jgi:hypothetical protein
MERFRKLWTASRLRHNGQNRGARVELENRAEFAQFTEQEANRWTKVVTDVKLTLD